MADVKIQMKIGEVEFSGEGEQAWVGAQLDRILKAAPTIVSSTPRASDSSPHSRTSVTAPDSNATAQTLASFLRDKNASTNQVKRFLATAVWLGAKGKNRLTTADVTRALKDSNQSRLGNPADCLNKNVAKGHCEKDGKEFFVTTEGAASL
ncbi:MAG: hypothetical protein DME76_12180 [Verrucomicrobia bacterium]|nr:MAG: hypothetical protein DME76_12180 [Verrucomicrobiota bacterium]